MDLLLHFKVNEGDENNINIQEYMLYGDVETKSEKCLVDEGDEVVLTEFPVPEFKNCTLMKKGDEGFYEYKGTHDSNTPCRCSMACKRY